MSMSVNDLYVLFRMYSNRLRSAGVHPRKGPTDRLMDLHMDRQHIRWMCDEMERTLGALVDDGYGDVTSPSIGLIAKANRWLGYVQHGLMIHGLHTIEEMKAHNKRTP